MYVQLCMLSDSRDVKWFMLRNFATLYVYLKSGVDLCKYIVLCFFVFIQRMCPHECIHVHGTCVLQSTVYMETNSGWAVGHTTLHVHMYMHNVCS